VKVSWDDKIPNILGKIIQPCSIIDYYIPWNIPLKTPLYPIIPNIFWGKYSSHVPVTTKQLLKVKDVFSQRFSLWHPCEAQLLKARPLWLALNQAFETSTRKTGHIWSHWSNFELMKEVLHLWSWK
jgi:hypothetical protein